VRIGSFLGPSVGVGGSLATEAAPHPKPPGSQQFGKPPRGSHSQGAGASHNAVGNITSGFEASPGPPAPRMDQVWADVAGGMAGALTPSPPSSKAGARAGGMGGGQTPVTPTSALTKSLLTVNLQPLRRIDSGLLHNTATVAPNVEKRLTPDDFEMLCLVGQGAFGKVFQVRKRDNGAVYAVRGAYFTLVPSHSPFFLITCNPTTHQIR
jgi:hypothetical protein